MDLTPVFTWLTANPGWAGLIVMLLSLGESLLVVGLIVPGTVVMFGIGALVGTGVLPLWTTIGWAMLGAVLGDGASYAIGHYFRERLATWWPFSRYPQMLQRGQTFFEKHGGKSIFFGRFVGPVRPVVPAIAGMMGMPMPQFFLYNVLSAIGWAPAYMLPGIVFGTSVGLAGEVATRLAILLIALVTGAFVLFWLVHRLVLFIQPRASAWLVELLQWSRIHPRMGSLTSAVVDPQAPEMRGLFFLAVLLVSSVLIYIAVLNNFEVDKPLIRADVAVLHWFRELSTPWADELMIWFFELGDRTVITALIVAISLWLLKEKNWSALGHWLAAVLFGVVAVVVFKYTLVVVRPEAELITMQLHPFPSWHALMAVITFGFLAVLVAAEMAVQLRWWAYATAALITMPIVVAGLYLGAYWLSDVLVGLALGLAWLAFLGIAYRRRAVNPVSAKGLTLVASITLLSTISWIAAASHDQDVKRYQVRYRIQTIDYAQWLATGWQQFPASRLDIAGRYKQPLDIQWAGSLESIKKVLSEQGWQEPVVLSVRSALYWLTPEPTLAELPLLPQAHNGRHEMLSMVYRYNDAEQLVLRLWSADALFTGASAAPLWLGNVSRQNIHESLGLLSLPQTQPNFIKPRSQFSAFLQGTTWQLVQRGAAREWGRDLQWDGAVLLVSSVEAPRL